MEGEVRRVIGTLLRDAWAASLAEGQLESMVVAAAAALRAATADGDQVILLQGDVPLLEEAGVRALIARAGVGRPELEQVIAAMSASGREHLEDDIVTRLGEIESPSLRFEIAEPSESAEAASAVADGIRREARDEPAGELWSAALKSLEEEGVQAARAAALEGTSAAAALRASMTKLGVSLLSVTAELWPLSDASERSELVAIVSHQLADDAASSPDPAKHLEELLSIRSSFGDVEGVETLFERAVDGFAIGALSSNGASQAEVGELAWKAPGGPRGLVQRISTLPPSMSRDRALRSLAQSSDVAGSVRDRIDELDRGASAAVLDGMRHAPAGEDTLALFRAALDAERPELRARGLSWIVHRAPELAMETLEACLRGDDRGTRLGSLWLALQDPELALAVIPPWARSDDLAERELNERRLGVLAYVGVAGDAALDELRKTLRATAFRKKAREGRAAAIAGLGALGDEASLPLLKSLAKKRGGTDPVSNEAATVVDAFEAGEAPYPDVLTLVERDLELLGLLDAVRASVPPSPVAQSPAQPTRSEPARSERVASESEPEAAAAALGEGAVEAGAAEADDAEAGDAPVHQAESSEATADMTEASAEEGDAAASPSSAASWGLDELVAPGLSGVTPAPPEPAGNGPEPAEPNEDSAPGLDLDPRLEDELDQAFAKVIPAQNAPGDSAINLAKPSSSKLRSPRAPDVDVPEEDEWAEDAPDDRTRPAATAYSPGFRPPIRIERTERPSSLPPPPPEGIRGASARADSQPVGTNNPLLKRMPIDEASPPPRTRKRRKPQPLLKRVPVGSTEPPKGGASASERPPAHAVEPPDPELEWSGGAIEPPEPELEWSGGAIEPPEKELEWSGGAIEPPEPELTIEEPPPEGAVEAPKGDLDSLLQAYVEDEDG